MSTPSEPLTLASVLQEAAARGTRAGKAAASWKFDGNTPLETYAAFLAGWKDGDQMVLDMYAPPAWLSGEWAEESVTELLGDLIVDYLDAGNPVSHSEPSLVGDWDAAEFDVSEEYVAAAENAYWEELERFARSAVALD